MPLLGSWETNTYTLTDDEETSEPIDKRGRALGTIRNRSGDSITFDVYEMSEPGDTPNLFRDADGAQKTITIANNETKEFDPSFAHIAILVLKLSDGSEDADVTVHISR